MTANKINNKKTGAPARPPARMGAPSQRQQPVVVVEEPPRPSARTAARRNYAEEADKLIAKSLSKAGKFGGNSKGDSRLRLFRDHLEESARSEFDYLRCLMYPSEEYKARMPDLETTIDTSLNCFFNTGTITASDTGDFLGYFAPFCGECFGYDSFSGSGATTTWGVTAGGVPIRNISQISEYASAVSMYRCTGYAIDIAFNGNLTTTQGQFAIAEAPSGFIPTSFSDITKLPGARFGTVPQLFEKGAYHFFGSFYGVDRNSVSTNSTGTNTFPTWSPEQFHKVGQAPYSNVSSPLGWNVPKIVFGFIGLQNSGEEITISSNQVFEGMVTSTLLDTKLGSASASALSVAKLAGHEKFRDGHLGHKSHHRVSHSGGMISSLWDSAKTVPNYIVDHWDGIKEVGGDVLKVAGAAAGLLPLLL